MPNIPNLLFGRTPSEYSILLIWYFSKIIEKCIGNMFSRCHGFIDHLLCYGKIIFFLLPLSPHPSPSPFKLISGIHGSLLHHVFPCAMKPLPSARWSNHSFLFLAYALLIFIQSSARTVDLHVLPLPYSTPLILWCAL